MFLKILPEDKLCKWCEFGSKEVEIGKKRGALTIRSAATALKFTTRLLA